MKIKTYLTLVLVSSCLFCLGCDENSPLSLAFDPPECSITNISEDDHRPGHFARYYITVSNNSEPIAFDVGCVIKLKRVSVKWNTTVNILVMAK